MRIRDLASPDGVNANLAVKQKTFEESQLWPWQQKFFKKAKALNLIYLNSPTGSGKSMPIIFLCAHHAHNGGKVVIVVPTHEISTNFKNPEPGFLLRLKWASNDIDWRPLPPEKSGRTDALKKFLRTRGGKGVVIATHQALALIAKDIAADPSMLDDVLLVIDEAHHVRHDEQDSITDDDYSRLGLVTRIAVARSLQWGRTRVALVTATPFRGDRLPILDDETLTKHFKRFVRTMEEHLIDAQIAQIRMHLITYKGLLTDYPHAVGQIYTRFVPKLKLATDCGVVWMPHTSSRYNNMGVASHTSKNTQLDELLRNLTDIGKRKVIDLVSLDKQKANQAKFCLARESGTQLEENTIVAMNLFQEGADHPKVDHVISIGYQGSFNKMVHRIGRTTRRYPDKKVVHVFLVMPRGHDPEDAVEFNRFLKTICMALIGQEIFVTRQKEADTEEDEESDRTGRRRTDPRTVTEKQDDLDAAIEALAAAVETCEKDKHGDPTPRAIAVQLHGAAAEAAAQNAADRGDSKNAQQQARRDAKVIMPRLLYYMATWFSDEIDINLVEFTRNGHHASRPISITTLRRFRKLVAAHNTNTKADAIEKVNKFARTNARMPSRSKTNPRDQEIYDLYIRLTNEYHPWYVPGYKTSLRDLSQGGTPES